MRISCNGCRILRKGCGDDCILRPCLQWINSPESQANATLFLAKFYGRAGLLNLINAGPQHLRPAVFKSLLYEACGRIVNPVYGSLGLFWTGEWARCQAAVDAVLMGSEIKDVADSGWQAEGHRGSDTVLLPACDIRHVAKNTDVDEHEGKNKKVKGRARFKRSGTVIKPKPRVGSVDSEGLWKPGSGLSGSHESMESVSKFSVETVEASLVNRNEPEQPQVENDDRNGAGETQVDLDLTLG